MILLSPKSSRQQSSLFASCCSSWVGAYYYSRRAVQGISPGFVWWLALRFKESLLEKRRWRSLSQGCRLLGVELESRHSLCESFSHHCHQLGTLQSAEQSAAMCSSQSWWRSDHLVWMQHLLSWSSSSHSLEWWASASGPGAMSRQKFPRKSARSPQLARQSNCNVGWRS